VLLSLRKWVSTHHEAVEGRTLKAFQLSRPIGPRPAAQKTTRKTCWGTPKCSAVPTQKTCGDTPHAAPDNPAPDAARPLARLFLCQQLYLLHWSNGAIPQRWVLATWPIHCLSSSSSSRSTAAMKPASYSVKGLGHERAGPANGLLCRDCD
jgi:hypothetical protein